MPRFARCVFAVFLAVSCLTSSLTCQAAAPETAAAAFILMEADSGRVLASRNETQERSIASTTKIMTCLIALEHSELTEKVTVKREHLREGSSMYLLEGETLTMEERRGGVHRRPLRRERRQRAVCPMDERKGESPRHGAHVICQPERARRSGARLLPP